MKKITENIEEYFDGVETTKDYYGYFYSLTETIIMTILGTFCGLKSIKQIQKWAFNLVGGQTKNSTISFDGKTVRSTGKMKNYTKPLHIVSGHLAELGITLGQTAVNDKSNQRH
jgi:hypothetical protein